MLELGTSDALLLALGALGLGIVMLVKGGNWTIDAAIYIARHLGVPPLVVGFTIVAFGTSLPELIVSVDANLKGAPGIAYGNVLGSNIANILLVIGATAFVSTIVAKPKALFLDLMMMLAATMVLAGLMVHGEVSRLAGGLMIAAIVAFTFWQYKRAHVEDVPPEMEEAVFASLPKSLLYLTMGLGFVAVGAEFLVSGAKVSASVIGVPDAVIALSIVAVGTSLPELSTCLIAARKKQTGIVLGNIIGSNLFNILMIIGTTAVVKPLVSADIAPQLIDIDIWVTLGVSVFFALVLLLYKKVDRPAGILFLAGYVVYVLAIYGLYMK